MVRCCAPDCTNDSTQPSGRDLSFYSFPADEDLRSEWIRNLGRIARCAVSSTGSHRLFQPTRHDRLCSAHFEPNQFKRNMMAEFVTAGMMATRKRPHLKLISGAVPTIFSHKEAGVKKKAPRRESAYLKRKHEATSEDAEEVSNIRWALCSCIIEAMRGMRGFDILAEIPLSGT